MNRKSSRGSVKEDGQSAMTNIRPLSSIMSTRITLGFAIRVVDDVMEAKSQMEQQKQ